MKPSELIESTYMTAEDFGKNGIPLEPRVTIKEVVKEKDGRKWPLINFVEKWAKPLKINATHRRALCLMFGDRDTKDWHGKRLDLYIMRGNFKEGKTTAVRFKGSPDISRAYSFRMQRFGGGYDNYDLQPTGKNVVLGPGYVRFGRKAGHWGKPFGDFQTEQLVELADYAAQQLTSAEAASWKPSVKADLEANVRELREEIAARTAPPPPVQEIEKPDVEEIPV